MIISVKLTKINQNGERNENDYENKNDNNHAVADGNGCGISPWAENNC